MVEGRRRDAWQHTSHLRTQLANTFRMNRDDPVFTPDDFDPFAFIDGRLNDTPITHLPMQQIKQILCG